MECKLILGYLIVLIAKMNVKGLVRLVAPAEEVPTDTPAIAQVLIADTFQVSDDGFQRDAPVRADLNVDDRLSDHAPDGGGAHVPDISGVL